ncbi:hypothetical protein K443DRAFT_222364 [Laccaria amethystina LaAM-08-1]|uniref:Uncharacterized protein n=1 Tax=Laccaria amethystina LaAM-08-1 TaxID=1095629 RepID=A0A0C9WYW7_9AGAR|nr:hypothetical protein K443DRAFT_222364 [Laccaria amethystina LaAM-08-1]
MWDKSRSGWKRRLRIKKSQTARGFVPAPQFSRQNRRKGTKKALMWCQMTDRLPVNIVRHGLA